MLKLNASYSKKVPADTEYSSQSYHASVEVELPDGLTPEQLNAKIRETFALVRDSVETEVCENLTYKADEDYWFWNQRGCDMLDVALAEWPDDYTVKSVAEAFSVNVPGLSMPLIGEFDLVVTDGGDEAVVDWKTSTSKWPAGKVDRDLQATAFCYAYQQVHGRSPIFRFDVFTKAKTPVRHQFYTVRTQDELDRFVHLANRIEEAVNTGVFVPVESCMNCSDCPYSERCKREYRNGGGTWA